MSHTFRRIYPAIRGIPAAIVLACTMASEPAFAVPDAITVQGRLTDSSGLNRNGTFVLEFKIYNANQGGSDRWTKTLSVGVTNGTFQVALEGNSDVSPNPNIVDIFDGGSRFLQIKVMGGPQIGSPEPAMVPRQRLVSVPFAIKAQVAETLSTSQVPVGTVVTYYGSTAPDGWLECNGAPVFNTTPHEALFEQLRITLGLPSGLSSINRPDLRGVFVRGLDNGRNKDPDLGTRTMPDGSLGYGVGSYQDDEFEIHDHSEQGFRAQYPSWTYRGDRTERAAYSRTGPAGESTETRPKNVYLMFIIKY